MITRTIRHIPFQFIMAPITLTCLHHSFHQVLHVKFQGILLQLAEGVQGFAPNQLAKGVTLSESLVFGLLCSCSPSSVGNLLTVLVTAVQRIC